MCHKLSIYNLGSTCWQHADLVFPKLSGQAPGRRQGVGRFAAWRPVAFDARPVSEHRPVSCGMAELVRQPFGDPNQVAPPR
jgi:hypothetical protein